MATRIETAFTEAFQAFMESAKDEASFYSNKAYQVYYDYNFRTNYKSYKHQSLEELDIEEDVIKAMREELCQALRKKQKIELQDYKLCCELDAELDAIRAAYRRWFRVNSA